MLGTYYITEALRTSLRQKDFKTAKNIIDDYNVDFFDVLYDFSHLLTVYNKWSICRRLPYFQELYTETKK
jgi:hypothetical protein